MKKRTKGIIIFLICLVLVVLVATMLSDNGAGEISYTSLVEDIKAGKVSNIQITGDYVLKVRYNDSKIAEKNFPNKYDAFCYIPDRNVQQVYDMIEDGLDVSQGFVRQSRAPLASLQLAFAHTVGCASRYRDVHYLPSEPGTKPAGDELRKDQSPRYPVG